MGATGKIDVLFDIPRARIKVIMRGIIGIEARTF
jgi:hypothetical protein